MDTRRNSDWLFGAALAAAALPALLGGTVIIGWYAGLAGLVQINPAFVPMQFNTALAFLLAGAALLGLITGMRLSTLVMATLVLAVGLVTLIEFVFLLDLGIDQLFMEHYITVATSQPGRMAPNTALCFFLSGLALVFAVRATSREGRCAVVGLLGSIVAALGLIALFGYMSHIEAAYGWGRLTQMAVHTSAGFVLLGSGIVLTALHVDLRRGSHAPRWLAYAAGVAVATLTLSMWQALAVGLGGVESLLPAVFLVTGLFAAAFASLTVHLTMASRRRSEQISSINEELQRWEMVFKHATWGIVVYEADTRRMLSANPAYAGMHGYAPEELQDMDLNALLSAEDRALLPALTEHLRSSHSVVYESNQVRKDGSLFPARINATAIYGNHGRVAYHAANVQDLTEEKKVASEKQTVEAHLRQQQRLESIGTLAGGVAHEINNPLMGIMNYAALIDSRLEDSSPLHEFARGIVTEAERAATIVRQLLSFARDDEEAHSPAEIADLVNDTLALVRTIIRRDQITLELDVPDDLPSLKCRSQQVQQVLMNLLTNARDALNERYRAHDENKIISVTVRPFERSDRHWMRITVEDRGRGVPEEFRDRIFDPFFTTKDRAIGTGLGLSISHGIVQDHHGELRMESDPGQFTRFHLELPVDNGWDLGEPPDQATTELGSP